MPLANFIVDRLKQLGIDADSVGNLVILKFGDLTTKLKIEEEINAEFDVFEKIQNPVFDTSDLSVTFGGCVEIPIVRLNAQPFRDLDEEFFTDGAGRTVEIHRASDSYRFTHFKSPEYIKFFDSSIRSRLEKFKGGYTRSAQTLFRTPLCAKFTTPQSVRGPELKALAVEKIRACLVKMAVEKHQSYEIVNPNRRFTNVTPIALAESDHLIPKVIYDSKVVSYYKVARSSPFPSQSFLAYYNVLEYYFLKVTEDSLHHQLRAYLNGTSFKTNTEGLDQVIALVRRHGSTDDETEMLRRVIERFVFEDDLVKFITELEQRVGSSVYSKRKLIFGIQFEISLRDGHTSSNAANVVKHIRNAIVHSSDRHKREESHVPLSETEHVIDTFIPLIQYLAEKVMYGTGISSSA